MKVTNFGYWFCVICGMVSFLHGSQPDGSSFDCSWFNQSEVISNFENISSKNNITSENFPNYLIHISHEIFNTEVGYIPSVIYQVTIEKTDPSKDDVKWLTIKSVRPGSETSYPGSIQTDTGHDGRFCVSQNAIYVEIRQPTLILQWKAPENTDCIQFKLSALRESAQLDRIFCKREDCYGYYKKQNGTVTSPKYPDKYPDNYNCTTIIETEKDYFVYLQFQSLHFEAKYEGICFDYVTVSYTEKNSSASEEPLCGEYSVEDLRNLTFVSDSHYVIIRLISDSKLAYSGFSTVFYSVDKSGSIGCDQVINGGNGTLSSPNYPLMYFPNIRCELTLRALTNHHIVVHFTYFDLQNATAGKQCPDTITVQTTNQTRPHNLCGWVMPPSPLLNYTSSLNWMHIVFTTDYIVQSRGYYATFYTVSSCRNHTYHGKNGTLSSILYPLPYLDNQECFSIINISSPYYVVELQFQFLHTETVNPTYVMDEDCTKDYVEIYDGQENGTHRRCGKWAGEETKLKFRSEGQVMILKFVSDMSVTAPGFSATWKAVINDTTKIQCPGSWTGYDQFCFQFIQQRKTWIEAKSDCEDLQSHLVKITSTDIAAFIESELSNNVDEAYWIGASDVTYEADFFWVDGTRVQYSDWFPGWPNFNYYGRQPNDDGLSKGDCVEIRRVFSYPSKGKGIADRHHWNDRQCDTNNSYICQKLKPGVIPTELLMIPDCSYNIQLSLDSPEDTVTSPNYPDNYWHFLNCNITINVPDDYEIEVTFDSFHLENATNCIYDKLELHPVRRAQSLEETNILCGNWESKLKFLHHISKGPLLHIIFVSDHSKHFRGFSLKVKLTNAYSECGNSMWRSRADICYYIDYTETWSISEAEDKCLLLGGDLASVRNHKQNTYLVNALKSQTEFSRDGLYWLGGQKIGSAEDTSWIWPDGSPFNYTDWHPDVTDRNTSIVPGDKVNTEINRNTLPSCMGFLSMAGRIRWKPEDCQETGGYICERLLKDVDTVKFVNLTGEGGNITVNNYTANAHVTWRIDGCDGSRIIFLIYLVDLEYQEECLYDYLLIEDPLVHNEKRFCQFQTTMESIAVSSNVALLTFFSDYKTSGSGFHIEWKAVNISNPIYISEPNGELTSINYPVSYLNNLNSTIIVDVVGDDWIWVEFMSFSLDQSRGSCGDYLNLTLGNGTALYHLCPNKNNYLHNMKYLSTVPVLEFNFHTDSEANGEGFKAVYQSVTPGSFSYDYQLILTEDQNGTLSNLNHPHSYPHNISINVYLRAPLGYNILIEMTYLNLQNVSNCEDESLILIDDFLPMWNNSEKERIFCGELPLISVDRLKAISYLNYFTLKFQSHTDRLKTNPGYVLNYTPVKDVYILNKTQEKFNISVDTCEPSPCLNGASCIELRHSWYECICPDNYTGLLCAWTYCDSQPCYNGGLCKNNKASYNCQCLDRFGGKNCEVDLRLCANQRCGDKGVCSFNPQWSIYCVCDKGWKGWNCQEVEQKWIHPLMKEPFWIGIILILSGLVIMAFVICLKKRLLRKLDCCCCKKQHTTQEDKIVPGKDMSPITLEHIVADEVVPGTFSDISHQFNDDTMSEDYETATTSVTKAQIEDTGRINASYIGDEITETFEANPNGDFPNNFESNDYVYTENDMLNDERTSYNDPCNHIAAIRELDENILIAEAIEKSMEEEYINANLSSDEKKDSVQRRKAYIDSVRTARDISAAFNNSNSTQYQSYETYQSNYSQRPSPEDAPKHSSSSEKRSRHRRHKSSKMSAHATDAPSSQSHSQVHESQPSHSRHSNRHRLRHSKSADDRRSNRSHSVDGKHRQNSNHNSHGSNHRHNSSHSHNSEDSHRYRRHRRSKADKHRIHSKDSVTLEKSKRNGTTLSDQYLNSSVPVYLVHSDTSIDSYHSERNNPIVASLYATDGSSFDDRNVKFVKRLSIPHHGHHESALLYRPSSGSSLSQRLDDSGVGSIEYLLVRGHDHNNLYSDGESFTYSSESGRNEPEHFPNTEFNQNVDFRTNFYNEILLSNHRPSSLTHMGDDWNEQDGVKHGEDYVTGVLNEQSNTMHIGQQYVLGISGQQRGGDSAYQSTEYSTDKPLDSRRTSLTISRSSSDSIHQRLRTRRQSEENRVTSRLEMAAKKLSTLENQTDSHIALSVNRQDGLELEQQDGLHQASDSYDHQDQEQQITLPLRKLVPSRVLSVIRDEAELENTTSEHFSGHNEKTVDNSLGHYLSDNDTNLSDPCSINSTETTEEQTNILGRNNEGHDKLGSVEWGEQIKDDLHSPVMKKTDFNPTIYSTQNSEDTIGHHCDITENCEIPYAGFLDTSDEITENCKMPYAGFLDTSDETFVDSLAGMNDTTDEPDTAIEQREEQSTRSPQDTDFNFIVEGEINANKNSTKQKLPTYKTETFPADEDTDDFEISDCESQI